MINFESGSLAFVDFIQQALPKNLDSWASLWLRQVTNAKKSRRKQKGTEVELQVGNGIPRAEIDIWFQ